MAAWNVTACVLAIVDGETGEAAQARLEDALRRAGFELYWPSDPANADLRPIEAEEGMEAWELPGN